MTEYWYYFTIGGLLLSIFGTMAQSMFLHGVAMTALTIGVVLTLAPLFS